MKLRKAGTILAGVALSFLCLSCARRNQQTEMTVLIRMMPAQERFFREEIVSEFERQNNCKINIATFTNQWDIERLLKLEKSKRQPEIALVKTPFEVTRVLVKKGFMQPLTDVVDSSVVMQDLAEYHQLATGLGFIQSRPYYIPRKLETRVMFYRKSMVEDAVSKYPQYQNKIDNTLKSENGHGLPSGYELEKDPGRWDLYDLFVVGYIWAQEEYNGVTMPRLAHRGARYEGTALDLVDRSLQMGASHEEIIRLGSGVVQTLLWERVLVENKLYNPGMWQDPWRGSDLYNGIKDGKVFLTFLQQIDCFNVHGWSDDPGMPTYLPDINDMGLAVMPQAVSFELTQGTPRVEGSRSTSTGGWWWGVPQTSPEPELAYKLARFITNRENQAKECSRFGMIAVRKDILMNLPEVFQEGWVGDIFKVSVEQVKINELTTVPLIGSYTNLAQILIDSWYDLCIEAGQEDGPLSAQNIKQSLDKDYLPKVKQELGEDFPQ